MDLNKIEPGKGPVKTVDKDHSMNYNENVFIRQCGERCL